MRLLVVGHGFVGTHVVRCLLERQNHRVFTLCRSQNRDDVPAGCSVVVGDLESVDSLSAALTLVDPDAVINCAGLYAWWHPDPDVYERLNVGGVRNLVAAITASAPHAALVQVSTVLAYGRCCRPEEVFTEGSPFGPPASLYASSKARGDAIAQSAFDEAVLAGGTLYLACCIGSDPKLIVPERDVMRIADLVTGALPATVASETTFTYVAVRDAAEAIVRVAERLGRPPTDDEHHRPTLRSGDRWLIGDQRLATREYYALVAELSGQPSPAYEVPGWLALVSARAMTWWATRVSGKPPTAPTDVVRTALHGSLCFSAAKSKAELGLRYTPIRSAFAEAIDYITDGGSVEAKVAHPAMAGWRSMEGAGKAAEERVRLVADAADGS